MDERSELIEQTIVYQGIARNRLSVDSNCLVATLYGLDGVESVNIITEKNSQEPRESFQIIGRDFDLRASLGYVSAMYNILNSTTQKINLGAQA